MTSYRLPKAVNLDFTRRIPPDYNSSIEEKIIILDDILDDELISQAQDIVRQNRTRGQSAWYKKEDDEVVDKLTEIAALYFDLTSAEGCEVWSAKTNTNYHVDMDEQLWESQRKVQTPLCSIVYYAAIDNLTGGKFITQSMSIEPKTNRMIVFSPGIYHAVEQYTGTRDVLAVNPFKKIIYKYSWSMSLFNKTNRGKNNV